MNQHTKHYLSHALLTVIVIVGVLYGSYTLKMQDTSLKSYLSGVMVSTMGGSGDNQLIRVNLHNHSLTLFEDGNVYFTGSIAATGNPYDRTATPVGEFRILSKERSHTSSLSGVIMPWAMRFYRGYYFHDIPLTPSGVVISTKYSHGCIRLPTVDVRTIYDWTRVGARVVVYRAHLVKDSDSAMVYYLTEQGIRQPIADPTAFTTRGFRWHDVVTIPATELASLPIGATLY